MFEFINQNFYSAVPLLFLSFLAFYYLFLRYVILKKTFSHIKRFELFRIRDEMRKLVAFGVIDENSDLFKDFDKLACGLIQHTESFNLKNIKTIIKRHGKALSEEANSHQEKTFKALEKSDKRVVELHVDLYREIIKIMIFQSKGIFIVGFVQFLMTKLFHSTVGNKNGALFTFKTAKKSRDLISEIDHNFLHA